MSQWETAGELTTFRLTEDRLPGPGEGPSRLAADNLREDVWRNRRLAAGKLLESTIRTRPPLVRTGC